MPSSRSGAKGEDIKKYGKNSNDEEDLHKLAYIDAGANLLDEMYQGRYHGKVRHDPDLHLVMRRAYYHHNVQTIIALAGNLDESRRLLDLVTDDGTAPETPAETPAETPDGTPEESEQEEQVFDRVFTTVGVHPTRCAEVFATHVTSESSHQDQEPTNYKLLEEHQLETVRNKFHSLIQRGNNHFNDNSNNKNKNTNKKSVVVAIGECGLDYARLQFCPKHIQQFGLRQQLEIAIETKLPLYLHNRDSSDDLISILNEYKQRLSTAAASSPAASDNNHDENNNVSTTGIRGIVHSFDATIQDAHKFINMGLYIGINGCSLKTPQNIQVLSQLPLDKLILETDCPWCDIRQTHASYQYAPLTRTHFRTKKEKQYKGSNAGWKTRKTNDAAKQTGEGIIMEGEVDVEYCVKNRTEPCHVKQVAEVVANVKGVTVSEVVNVSNSNVYKLFGNLNRK